MPYFVYILRCSDDTLYTGIATDVARRITEHNESQKGAKYTSGRRPVALVHQEAFHTRSEALKREAGIKKLSRARKEALWEGTS